MFEVTKIIDGNNIEVKPSWKLREKTGNRVTISGYSSSEDNYLAVKKLEILILAKQIQLGNPKEVIGNTITCAVRLNEIDISFYFPEFQYKDA